MQTAFNKTTGTWEIDWPGRISRHDLVYLSPPDDPMTGLPIGNGEVGVLCYVSSSKIVLVINRSDLWDDAGFGTFDCVAKEEEELHTTLRHGGRIIIDFNVPVFDLIYLSDFKGRLSIADGMVELRANGPFGAVSFKAFVCYNRDVLVCNIENSLTDRTVPVEIGIERYGSRMFHRWYSQVNPDPSLGIDGTESHAGNQRGFISHQLTTGRFALGCEVEFDNGNKLAFSRVGANRVTGRVTGEEAEKLRILCSITEPMEEDPLASAALHIQEAHETGSEMLLADTRKGWKEFWLRSLMECGDEFLDNVWHLVMYYSNASQRGKYPGRFCGFLWNWQHDFQAWGFYFHFNQQQVYWPLNAAGHHDLLAPYLNMRFNGLSHAKEDAERVFGVDGAVVSDVTERRGYNSKSQFHNHTPVAQIAMEFWKQYQFTGDREFLERQALPYLLEAATFFTSLLERQADGTYHATSGSAYEGGPLLRDAVTEIVTARTLFHTVTEALDIAGTDHPLINHWRMIAADLVQPTTLQQPDEVIQKKRDAFVLAKGFFKGQTVPTNHTYAAGWGIEEKRLMTSFSPVLDMELAVHSHPMWLLKGLLPRLIKDGSTSSTYGLLNLDAWQMIMPDTNMYNDKIFPGVELSTVFPSGTIGISMKDTEEYAVAVATAKLFACDVHGWIPFAAVLARLGLAEELSQMLKHIYQMEPIQTNGTVVDSSGLAGEFAGPEAPLDLRSSLAQYTTSTERFPIQTKSFRFFSIHSSLAHGLNEMLLQSHDGIIRVAPAVAHAAAHAEDHSRSARFTLHAVGGFIVSSEIEQGSVRWVAVKSRRGGRCRLQNPWSTAAVFRNGEFEGEMKHSVISCDTQTSDLLLFLPEQHAFIEWETVPIRHESNNKEKRSSIGKNVLGMPRTF